MNFVSSVTPGERDNGDLMAASYVALIEDDESLAMLLRYNLEAKGLKVEWMRNGATALKLLLRCTPKVAILDWNLPGLSGIELLRRIRKQQGPHRTAVVMLTGRVDPDDRSRALAAGADLFFGKPFAMQEFISAVTRLQVEGVP